eukprot:105108-Chlamydomonas_euryale.AAC.3
MSTLSGRCAAQAKKQVFGADKQYTRGSCQEPINLNLSGRSTSVDAQPQWTFNLSGCSNSVYAVDWKMPRAQPTDCRPDWPASKSRSPWTP